MSDSSLVGGFVDPRSWPTGVRFHPTDEELVISYLKRKICRRRLPMHAIREIDVYKWEPDELPEQDVLKSGDKVWYFFSPRDRKYPNGSRSNRATRYGYWKATGKDRGISYKSRSVGVKKTLVFYGGRAPKGIRTDWVMHEYTMDEEELKRCRNVQDSFAVYKLFKKGGPGPRNGEQYGAPVSEEESSDEGDPIDDNTPNQQNVERHLNGGALVNLSIDNQDGDPFDLFQEILNQIDDEPEINQPHNNGYVFPSVGAEEETQCTMVGPSLTEAISTEPRAIMHPFGEQCDAQASFDITQSATSHLIPYEIQTSFEITQSATSHFGPYEAAEVTSAPNITEKDPHTQEEDFLEINDLDPETSFSNMRSTSNTSSIEEIGRLNNHDIYLDAAMFLQDMGNQLDYQLPSQLNYADPISSQLWTHDQRCNVFASAESNQVVMAPPTSGVVHAGSSMNLLSEERQNQGGNEDGDPESWYTSGIWSYLGSIPTRPALASENALINRAFERVSSFGRVRIGARDAAVATGVDPAVGRRSVGRNKGFLLLSILVALCAVLWVLTTGTTVKALKTFLWRFISSS